MARPDYDATVGVVQVDSVTGAVLRDLPEDVLDGWFGLGDFVELAVTDATGQEVAGGRSRSARTAGATSASTTPARGPALPDVLRLFPALHPRDGLGHRGGWAARAFGDGDFESPRIRVPGSASCVLRIAERYFETSSRSPRTTGS